jgi:CBS domain-containing protein
MSKPLVNVSINSSVRDAIQTMQQKNIRRLVVSDGDKMVGIITDKDIFRTIMINQDLIPILLNDNLLENIKRFMFAEVVNNDYWQS